MKTVASILLGGLLAVFAAGAPARALDFPYGGVNVTATPHPFGVLVERLDAAVKANGMFVVTRASASAGAQRRGITIPGNIVVGVYRNDFAVRMLEASIPAGIEAPLVFYITVNDDGTATLSYRTPSATFAPYGSAALDAMAADLDAIFAAIAAAATAQD